MVAPVDKIEHAGGTASCRWRRCHRALTTNKIGATFDTRQIRLGTVVLVL